MADRPVMPSKPCEKFPGSNNRVVWPKSASTQEWPKCVSCMSTIVRSWGAWHAPSPGDDADRKLRGRRVCVVGCRPRGPGDLPASVRPDPGHGMGPAQRDTAELDIPLAVAGRGGDADDRDGDAAVPV